AFALYESKKKKLLLARDRIGIKPLYYTIVGGLLIFGSEIKSILQYDGINREIDKEGLSSYLTFGSVLGDKTLFKGIKKLEPGYILTYDGNRILTKKYYIMREEILYHNEDIAAKRLRQLLEESVNSQLMSDVPLGAFLSGGIDSSTVVGLMSRIVSRPVKTFTVGFGRSDDELKYAKIASEHFSTDHREIMVCPKDVPPIISKLVWHYDDLIWDAASVPTYFVSEFARKYVKVVLTGEGGDELFAGYNRYKPFSPYMALIPIPLKKYMFDKFVRLFDADDRERIYKFGKSYSENIENNYFKMKPILKGVLMFGRNETLPNQLLTKVDRASMAASLEARVPLLDNRMIDFSDSIPLSMKLKGFLGKYIIRKAVKDLVPTEIIKRKKQGFGASALQWFTNPEVMEFAENVLDRPHILLEGLDYSYVNSLMKLKGIRKGRQAYQLWSLLELEIWYRTFIEGNGSRQVKL
ncbi:MAG: asparagine synthase (glutamine-hydrolyzing), partial [Candidatus Bathyarchaeia archaeon]